jgi:hypothetical protein
MNISNTNVTSLSIDIPGTVTLLSVISAQAVFDRASLTAAGPQAARRSAADEDG